MTAKKIEMIEKELEEVVLKAREAAEIYGMQSEEFMVLADRQMSLQMQLLRYSKSPKAK